ncbi:PREDICTED: uncharacterized protein LOC105579106 [Cercocebus atys]|nr:PREDICTED: uncharacterized protein LOC105579106 [Cercocebus atys]
MGLSAFRGARPCIGLPAPALVSLRPPRRRTPAPSSGSWRAALPAAAGPRAGTFPRRRRPSPRARGNQDYRGGKKKAFLWWSAVIPFHHSPWMFSSLWDEVVGCIVLGSHPPLGDNYTIYCLS